MVDITPLLPADRQIIQAYGDGRFRITGVAYEGSVIVLPERTFAWPVGRFEEITLDSLADVVGAEPRVEILLIGCGPRLVPIAEDLRAGLRASGIVAEPMDTGAACRTYNVLVAEERRVAAALISVE